MDRNEAIEIPFGAKDSELKGWAYTIPEGMKARIEGNKVILEPKESEDERIRKALIRGIESVCKEEEVFTEGFTRKQIVSWLEKQGEQNLANSAKTCKVEPKFKIGDWITNGRYNKLVVGINRDWTFYIFKDGTSEHILDIDKKYHLWTIQDAKDGDVLSFNDGHGNDSIELIKSITDKKIEFWFCLTNGNRYEVFDGIPYTNIVSREDATPATKEQRETLFKAMHEAGYEWDAEKKELKKIEQEPTDNIESSVFRDKLLELFQKFRWIKKGVPTNGDIIEYVDTHIQELINTIQNPAWSEEDEERIEQICDDLKCGLENFRSGKNIKGLHFEEIIKSNIDWLKSLKERYAWKPTAQQLTTLSKVIELRSLDESDGTILMTLWNDLKKLKG